MVRVVIDPRFLHRLFDLSEIPPEAKCCVNSLQARLLLSAQST